MGHMESRKKVGSKVWSFDRKSVGGVGSHETQPESVTAESKLSPSLSTCLTRFHGQTSMESEPQ